MNYKVITNVFLFIGICFVGGGLYLYEETEKFLQRAISVEGEVVELERRSSDRTLFPIVRYTDHLGYERTLYSSAGSYPPSHFVGEKVKVVLDPNDPKYPTSAKIESFWHIWGLPWFLIIFGGFFVAISLLVRYVISKGGVIYFGKDKHFGRADR